MKVLLLTIVSILPLPLNIAIAKTVEKAAFVKHMGDNLPIYFCAEKTYFRTCFALSEKECVELVTSKTQFCLKELDVHIPKLLKEGEKESWGEKLGICVGFEYEKNVEKKKINSKDCTDRSKWM